MRPSAVGGGRPSSGRLLTNLQLAYPARSAVTLVAFARIFFHGAFHHVCVLAPRHGLAGSQHPAKKFQAGRLQRFLFLARCIASLPPAVRYEFCPGECASWGQMQGLLATDFASVATIRCQKNKRIFLTRPLLCCCISRVTPLFASSRTGLTLAVLCQWTLAVSVNWEE